MRLPLRRRALAAAASLALAAAGCGTSASSNPAPGASDSSAPVVATAAAPAPFADHDAAVALRAVRERATVEASASGQPPGDSAAAPEPPPSEAGTAAASAQAVSPAAMLIRTGTASIEVDSLDAAVARLRALAARLGGYVGNTALAGGRDQVRAATLELKLPAARFDDALAGLTPLGRVDSVATSAQDVGEEFVDVTARAGNARRLEARFLALLERRGDKLVDVLAVERELARVREEVDRYEGRLRYLRSRVALSTLAVTVHERVPLVGTSPAEGPVRAAFRQAWRNFVGLTAAAISASGVLVPLGLAGWAAWAAARRLRQRAARPHAA